MAIGSKERFIHSSSVSLDEGKNTHKEGSSEDDDVPKQTSVMLAGQYFFASAVMLAFSIFDALDDDLEATTTTTATTTVITTTDQLNVNVAQTSNSRLKCCCSRRWKSCQDSEVFSDGAFRARRSSQCSKQQKLVRPLSHSLFFLDFSFSS